MGDAESCHSLANKKHTLSLISSMVCAMFLVATVLTNILVLLVFKRKRRLFYKSMFYKLLLNITVADFLTGLVSDTVSISFLLKEYLGRGVSTKELKLVNFDLLLLNSVSILTMAMLCIERVILLMKPVAFQQGLKDWQSGLLVASIWLTAGLSSVPYLYMTYIKYLTIFSFANVAVTFACLLILTATYKKYLTLHRLSSIDSVSGSSKVAKETVIPSESSNLRGYIKRYQNSNAYRQTKGAYATTTSMDPSKRCSSILDQHRVNKTFLTMLLVYLVTYLPLTVMTAYMNLCMSCDCTLIQVMRDLTCLAILSSALLRPLNFIFRLRTIKKEVVAIMNFSGRSRSETNRQSINTDASSHTGVSFIIHRTAVAPRPASI